MTAPNSLPLEHLDRMTDSTGLIQHAIYSLPRRESGYTTDDNARALRLSSCRATARMSMWMDGVDLPIYPDMTSLASGKAGLTICLTGFLRAIASL
jgi:hypothetical protein